jgi:predicted PhzF superfamily epimerase YddE/YHI9
MISGILHRLSAFTTTPDGGNPAGVWVGDTLPDPDTMQRIAAAALGGYLRAAELITVPTTILIRQGEAMGRPSQLVVHIPVSGGIVVTGKAIRI